MENISIQQNLLGEFWTSMKLRLVHRFFPLVRNLRGHIRLRSLLSGARLVALSSVHPGLKYKYLRSNYLFSSLSIGDALAIVHHHYRLFGGVVADNFFPRLFDEKPLLWEFQKEATKFSIRMTFPHDLNRPKRMLDHEGDLALMFEVDGVPIYILCMTLVPNRIAKKYFDVRDDKDVMFIGRVQGVPDQFDKVRAATKLLHDITPARLLISATESIAKPFAIETIVGVCNSEQLSKRKDLDESECLFDYDAFWINIGALATSSGLFSYQLGISEKPIEEIQQKHRSRTLAKRRFRAEVVETLGTNFLREISYPVVPLNESTLLVHFGIRKF